MQEERISWAIPVLICAIIFTLAFGFSMFVGIIDFSIIGLGLDFLVGSLIGYILWLFFF